MADTHNSISVQQIEQQQVGQECFLASVLVPRTASTRDIVALETAMQGLVQDDRHPVALELAATASSRCFLLRATSLMSLQHLCSQVQARYPQAIIQPVPQEDDPLALKEGEAVSIVELCAGAAAYLPLRAFREREWLQEGADPLLGILGVFNHLPPQMRVVTQLALLPASPTWSRPYLRKAVEHPLEQEYLRARLAISGKQASGLARSSWSAWASWSRCCWYGGASSGRSTRTFPPGSCRQGCRCSTARRRSSHRGKWRCWSSQVSSRLSCSAAWPS